MRWLVAPMALLIFLGSISVAWAQVQSHPLSQISPIDSNLNMYTYNSSVGYLNYSYGIMNNGTQGILTADIASSAVTGSRIASGTVSSSKISNPLGGMVNATAYYDSDNSNYFLDPASSGTSLTTAGSAGIGTTSPKSALDVKSDQGLALSGSNFDDAYRIFRNVATGYLHLVGNQTTFSGFRFFVNGATEALTILNSGNVGVGTASPSSGNGGWTRLVEIANPTDAAVVFNKSSGPAQRWVAGVNSQGYFKIYDETKPSDVFTILNGSDNVGIGTTQPNLRLQVNDANNAAPASSGSVTGQVLITNGGTYATAIGTVDGGTQYSWIQGQYQNSAGTTRALALQPVGGNVGIGTTSPDAKLSTQDSAATQLTMYRTDNIPGNSAPVGYQNYKQNSAGTRTKLGGIFAYWSSNTAGAENSVLELTTMNNGAEAIQATLDSNGNVATAGTVASKNGANIVYRCTTAGTLPIGALTTNSSSCGATADTGLRVS